MGVFLHLIDKRRASEVGLRMFFTGMPCAAGHISQRWCSTGKCVACQVEYDRRRFIEQREEIGARHRAAHQADKDARNAQKRGYWAENRERMKAARSAWREKNRGHIRHLNALREEKIRIATPSWADRKKIRAVYELAASLTEETGIKHHVDHEIPLTGELVCGLHVEGNLRAIPWEQNLKKWRRYDVGS